MWESPHRSPARTRPTGNGDLVRRQVCVRRSDWNGQVTSPKGGRLRRVPLTKRLAAALRKYRHLQSPRVLCQDNGELFTRQMVQTHRGRRWRLSLLPTRPAPASPVSSACRNRSPPRVVHSPRHKQYGRFLRSVRGCPRAPLRYVYRSGGQERQRVQGRDRRKQW